MASVFLVSCAFTEFISCVFTEEKSDIEREWSVQRESVIHVQISPYSPSKGVSEILDWHLNFANELLSLGWSLPSVGSAPPLCVDLVWSHIWSQLFFLLWIGIYYNPPQVSVDLTHHWFVDTRGKPLPLCTSNQKWPDLWIGGRSWNGSFVGTKGGL